MSFYNQELVNKVNNNNEEIIKKENKENSGRPKTIYKSVKFQKKYGVFDSTKNKLLNEYKNNTNINNKNDIINEDIHLPFYNNNNLKIHLETNDDFNDLYKIKSPMYLKDCILGLNSQYRDRQELSLKALPGLIDNQPMDLDFYVKSLVLTLLSMNDNFDLDEMDELKEASLVKLAKYSPNEVTKIFCEKFFGENNCGPKIKFLIIDVLNRTVTELSEYYIKNKKPKVNNFHIYFNNIIFPLLSYLKIAKLTSLLIFKDFDILLSKFIILISNIINVSENHPVIYRALFEAFDLFKAIIIESEYDHWEPGEVKAIFEKANMSLYSVRFYMANKTAVETFATFESRGLLKVDFSKIEGANNSEFIKLYPIQQSSSPRPSSKPSSNYIASGTGFIISKDGYIATNAHVIDGSNRVTVDMLKDDKVVQYEAEVVVTDVANDVAIIKIVDDAFTVFNKLPYTIEPNINIGADVYTIGFPLNDVMGTNYKVANSIISAKTGIDDDIRYYQITVPIQPGNSGGPLINRNGNVVGLTTSRLNGNAVGTKVENVNYAIKSLYLLNVINMVPNMDDLPSASSIANMNMEEQIVVLKNYVCLIKIY